MARVTDDSWTACAVFDQLAFGLGIEEAGAQNPTRRYRYPNLIERAISGARNWLFGGNTLRAITLCAGGPGD